MPRPRLSHAEAQMKGSLAVNKGRFDARKNAPATNGSLGAPPRHLAEPVKKVWREIAKAIPAGVAGSADRVAVEIAANLLAQFRESPHVMQASRIALLMAVMSRLGLDPQARTRLQVQAPSEPQKRDEWSALEPASQTGRRNTPVM